MFVCIHNTSGVILLGSSQFVAKKAHMRELLNCVIFWLVPTTSVVVISKRLEEIVIRILLFGLTFEKRNAF